MSAALPEALDAWRMVTSQRIFSGTLPLASMTRLGPSLVDADGECTYRVEFGRDEFGVAFVQIDAQASLPLMCQRSLERFELPVQVSQRMGLIRSEEEESGLPAEYEPVLMPEDGRLHASELIEDELILALPVVPVTPGTDEVEVLWSTDEEAVAEDRPNPFAALSALKSSTPKQN